MFLYLRKKKEIAPPEKVETDGEREYNDHDRMECRKWRQAG